MIAHQYNFCQQKCPKYYLAKDENKNHCNDINRRGSQVVKASALQLVDMDSISEVVSNKVFLIRQTTEVGLSVTSYLFVCFHFFTFT